MNTNVYSVYTDTSSLTLRALVGWHWHASSSFGSAFKGRLSLSLRPLRPELVCLHAVLSVWGAQIFGLSPERLRALGSVSWPARSSGAAVFVLLSLCCSGRGGEAQDGQKADVWQRIARLPDNVVTGRDWRRRPISALKPSRGPASPTLHIYLPEVKEPELNVIS